MSYAIFLVTAALISTRLFGAYISIDTAPGVPWKCIWVTSLGGPGTSCPSTPGPVAYLGSTALGAWDAPVGGAQWAGPNAGAAPTSPASGWPLAGTYVYYLDFSEGIDFRWPYMSQLRIGSDNGITVELCTSTTSCLMTLYSNPNGTGYQQPFVTIPPQRFYPATGMRVTVVNAPLDSAFGASPSGFFIDGDIGRPEPSTVVMIGLGLTAILIARRGRRAQPPHSS